MSPEDSCKICGQVHSGTRCIDESSDVVYYKNQNAENSCKAQPDPAACLRALIEKYKAENVFPGSHLAGKVEGLKEAVAIVEETAE